MSGDQTKSRKLEHVQLSLSRDVQFKTLTTLFEHIDLLPNGSPEKISISSVRTGAKFLGKMINAPIFASGMTGGHEQVTKINLDIAEGISEAGLAMGVGSQRAMIEDPSLAYTYDVKKEHDLILMGNLGAAQTTKYSIGKIEGMVSGIEADALCIHTNPGQEAAQPEGNIDFRGVTSAISEISSKLGKPVIVKEVGNGISRDVALRLRSAGVYGIDTGGSGGTNWIAIELYRSKGKSNAEIFKEWGIPTAQSLIEIRSSFDGFVTATGGIRSGKDVAKAVALGADACGIGMPLVQVQSKAGAIGVHDYLSNIIEELKAEMARLNCRNIEDLRKIRFNISPNFTDILRQRISEEKLNILFKRRSKGKEE